MQYCTKCIMPITRPEQVFDERGICDACNSAVLKHHEIDWNKRRKEFKRILERYRNKDGDWWDCIVPVSGGKDSCYQAIRMRDEYGMHPLCVNHVPCGPTDLYYEHAHFLRDQGFDLITVGCNKQMYRKMVRKGFSDLGDSCWPEHIGVFTAPVRVAVQYKVPLLIWGENSQFEYGGPAHKRENNYLDRNWLEQFQMYGYRISDLYDEGFSKTELLGLTYPSDEEITRIGVTGLFLGYFEEWSGPRNVAFVKQLGWRPNLDGPVEEAYHDYENLDCKWASGLHDYMKFIKYGYARATDQLCIAIRTGEMDREKAIKMVRNYEGKVPMKYIPDFLEYTGFSEKEFYETLDRFTNRSLFLTDDDALIRDENGNLIKRDYGYMDDALENLYKKYNHKCQM